MGLNALYAARLAEELNDLLQEGKVIDIFSIDKTQLFFSFNTRNGKDFHLSLRFAGGDTHIRFPREVPSEHKRRQSQFRPIHGSSINKVNAHPGNRSFDISVNGSFLLVLAHGPNGNVLETDSEGTRHFRQSLASRQDYDIARIRELEQEQWPDKELVLAEARFLRGSLLRDWQHFSKQKGAEVRLTDWYDRYLKEPIFLNTTEEGYSLGPEALENGNPVRYDSIMEACHDWSELSLSRYYFSQEKLRLSSALHRELNSLKKREKALQTEEERLKESRNYRHLGDLIMSNLLAIKEGADTVTLNDYLSGKPLTVRLQSRLSPAENAERYYRKAKNQHLQEEVIAKQANALREKFSELSHTLEQVEQAETMKELRPYIREKKQENRESERLPYHRFELDGFEILVGKQARDNDFLSFKVAHKDDLWLHAKDVPGSHVIIRKKGNSGIPDTVLECAAGLALWFSKRRNEAHAPVIHTEKKHLRKRKGDPAGLVHVEKESVLMASPVDPDQFGNRR